jgi:hypothetical protein
VYRGNYRLDKKGEEDEAGDVTVKGKEHGELFCLGW